MFDFRVFLLILSLSLCSCHRSSLQVTQVILDKHYLASTHVQTPDPVKKVGAWGQKLIVQWLIPSEVLKQRPVLKVSVIYKNFTQKDLSFPIFQTRGSYEYLLEDKEYEELKGILTYRVQIILHDGTVYSNWDHQLWVDLVHL